MQAIGVLRRWLNALYIETAETRVVADRLNEIVDENAETGPGAKGIASVAGANTLGKSTAVRRWAMQKYVEWTADSPTGPDELPTWNPQPTIDADLCPVVWLNLQSGAMVKGFNSQVLDFFRLPASGAAHQTSTAAVRALARHGARALVIDDFHLLRTNWKGGREVLDHVKYMNTELGEFNASLILVGTDLRTSPMMSDAQIVGRLQPMDLAPYGIETSAEQHAWQQLMYRLEGHLLPHLPRASEGLFTSQLAGPIWKRTQGYVGDATRLLRIATLAAITDGTYTICADHLKDVRLSDRAHTAEAEIDRRRRSRRSRA
ncbi:TniB family NTP-binding protein [Gordonia sp. HY002]|uniref:TniB family NTP-binding protein n=1 Tax=Gordonia zhenghanii TaxID=2911516 RepID=UPI001EF11EB6|nr:TniB family NTP-binding protein [Gordonia zhenghanii]MCF8572137.1 TniB family NTP-binding protein [Gordonia zhenghanii]MCF8604279.1 TniB family NTP-binding protein [Gordonia zhenghanii]